MHISTGPFHLRLLYLLVAEYIAWRVASADHDIQMLLSGLHMLEEIPIQGEEKEGLARQRIC